MGRGGVTLSEVEQAALYLQDKGRTPTVDGIREYLGTGSRTTLAAHLKKWKDSQQDGTGHIPKQLASVVAGLWDQLQEQANNRMTDQQEKFDTEIGELRKALMDAQSDAMKQAALFAETRQQLDDSRNEAADLGKRLQEASQSCERLGILNETALKQLDDAKAENQRLHDLSRQIQKNLEHYQEAIHRQKTEDSLRQEKQQATFRQEISVLEQTLADITRRLTAAEKDASLHAQEAATKQAELVNLRERHDFLVKEYRQKENDCIQLTTRHNMLIEQHDRLEKALAETQVLLQASKQQEAVLDSRLKNSEAALIKTEDMFAEFKNEKLFSGRNISCEKMPSESYEKPGILDESEYA